MNPQSKHFYFEGKSSIDFNSFCCGLEKQHRSRIRMQSTKKCIDDYSVSNLLTLWLPTIFSSLSIRVRERDRFQHAISFPLKTTEDLPSTLHQGCLLSQDIFYFEGKSSSVFNSLCFALEKQHRFRIRMQSTTKCVDTYSVLNLLTLLLPMIFSSLCIRVR